MDIIEEIVDRALGGYEPTIDNKWGYPDLILDLYLSDDCPEPLNAPRYQKYLRGNTSEIRDKIYRRLVSLEHSKR